MLEFQRRDGFSKFKQVFVVFILQPAHNGINIVVDEVFSE